MLTPMVNNVVNITAVKMTAKTAMRFLVRLFFMERPERRRIAFLLFTLSIAITYNPAVLNADDPVRHLGNFFIMCNHNDRLFEFIARYL